MPKKQPKWIEDEANTSKSNNIVWMLCRCGEKIRMYISDKFGSCPNCGNDVPNDEYKERISYEE